VIPNGNFHQFCSGHKIFRNEDVFVRRCAEPTGMGVNQNNSGGIHRQGISENIPRMNQAVIYGAPKQTFLLNQIQVAGHCKDPKFFLLKTHMGQKVMVNAIGR